MILEDPEYVYYKLGMKKGKSEDNWSQASSIKHEALSFHVDG